MSPGTRLLAAFSLVSWTAMGAFFMVLARQEGVFLLIPLILVLPALLAWGGVVVSFSSRFVDAWRGGGQYRQKWAVAGLVAGLAGGGMWLGVEAAVPTHLPNAELVSALGSSCSGDAVPGAGAFNAAGNHVVILDAGGRQSSWSGRGPLAWKPDSLADAELVACIADEETVREEVCEYTAAAPIVRYRSERDVTVAEAVSGRVVARFTVSDSPRRCATSEPRDLTALRGEVTWAMVLAQLTPLVEHGVVPVTPLTPPPIKTAPPIESAGPPIGPQTAAPVQPATAVPPENP